MKGLDDKDEFADRGDAAIDAVLSCLSPEQREKLERAFRSAERRAADERAKRNLRDRLRRRVAKLLFVCPKKACRCMEGMNNA